MQASASDYLASERTFLAWVRTGIALMGLGFVLARFGLFLEEFNRLDPAMPLRPYRLSLWIGVALILALRCVFFRRGGTCAYSKNCGPSSRCLPTVPVWQSEWLRPSSCLD